MCGTVQAARTPHLQSTAGAAQVSAVHTCTGAPEGHRDDVRASAVPVSEPSAGSNAGAGRIPVTGRWHARVDSMPRLGDPHLPAPTCAACRGLAPAGCRPGEVLLPVGAGRSPHADKLRVILRTLRPPRLDMLRASRIIPPCARAHAGLLEYRCRGEWSDPIGSPPCGSGRRGDALPDRRRRWPDRGK